MSPVRNSESSKMTEMQLFLICSVGIFCFSSACFLLKPIEILCCINLTDFILCMQTFGGDAEFTCTVSARQSKAILLLREWE